MKNSTYWAVLNTKNNTLNTYKDKLQACKEAKTTVRTLNKYVKLKNYLTKGDFYIYPTEIIPSNRGNPHF